MKFEEAIQKAHIAETRNGNTYIIVRYDDKFRLVRSGGWCGPYAIDGNGKDRRDKDYDIVRLYIISETNANCLNSLLCSDNKEIIWKEEPPVLEVSMQEIADKFNVPMEYLRIKE